jgi:hypothetical protein
MNKKEPMNAIYFDSPMTDELRRSALYRGQLFVYSPSASAIAFCDLARQMISDAFGALDPLTAQYHLPVEEYAAILAELKPKFIHHPDSKKCLQGMLQELGCDLEKTYFDLPRMRTATSDNYLTSGIAYAFHPHRDTWYSAPQAQINWWLPIYPIESENAMAFHPRYWTEPTRNSSREYNYYQWNASSRVDAAKHVKSDTRKQPHAQEELELDPQIRVITPVGGLLMFSGAQMHSTVPNTSGYTRFSIDFRTVNLDDLEHRRGAPNIDSECTGTTLRDFRRGTDFAHLPPEIISVYDDESSDRGILLYQPEKTLV